MTSRQIAIVTGALISVLSAPAASQSSIWVDIKDPNELRVLHSNKTHKGMGGDGIPFVAHYRSDGKALLIREGLRVARTWEMKGNDQVCYTSGLFAGCRRFQRSKTSGDEFNVIHEDGWSVIFKVEDGIPRF
jgi:hypothetical protein